METKLKSNSLYKSRYIRKSFFYQISLLELKVYSGSFKFYKVFSVKMKIESPKRFELHKKIIEILQIARDTIKTLKRGEWTMKSIRKVWQQK